MATTGKVTMGEHPPPYPQPTGSQFHNPGYTVGPPQPMGYHPAPTTVVINQTPHHHQPPHHHHATTVIVHRHGVNHLLHFCISLFFFPWIFVWIFLCIANG
ncbi:hypothetical protein RvY_04784-2 [Ramazzottius varieornatus]|uniref:Uncharacterized protein n=1 Tax=Ramazzottius varieornatus TaxID=947166 RepID=A0A1D1UW21_RAMVA|nr:hypothetical protein RvY_04784-2 [Ramazzottius varieornatus]